jgi:hypothetical protein
LTFSFRISISILLIAAETLLIHTRVSAATEDSVTKNISRLANALVDRAQEADKLATAVNNTVSHGCVVTFTKYLRDDASEALDLIPDIKNLSISDTMIRNIRLQRFNINRDALVAVIQSHENFGKSSVNICLSSDYTKIVHKSMLIFSELVITLSAVGSSYSK